jgi:hypothetical protein
MSRKDSGMDERMQAIDPALEAEGEGGEPQLGDAAKGKGDDEDFIGQDIVL